MKRTCDNCLYPNEDLRAGVFDGCCYMANDDHFAAEICSGGSCENWAGYKWTIRFRAYWEGFAEDLLDALYEIDKRNKIMITKEKFKAYLEVQTGGQTNMLAVNVVSVLSGGVLSKKDVMDIIKDYGEYSKKFNLGKEDVEPSKKKIVYSVLDEDDGETD